MINVLFAILVLLVTGIIAAIVLALASHFMHVPVNETMEKVRGCLPGANCGACGYTGCDGYAEALANGEAKANLCVPGGADVSKAVAELLGVDAGDVQALVAYVHCNGTADATENSSDYEGPMSCSAMCLTCGGPGSCKFGCLGCGDCAKVCPVDAIYLENGIAKVDKTKCICCGLCVKTCPKHIISLVPKDAKVAVICSSHDSGADTRKKCKNGCIACRKCEKTCPYGAITVEGNLAVVNYEKCTGCGMCAEVCPVGCIAKLGEFNEQFRK